MKRKTVCVAFSRLRFNKNAQYDALQINWNAFWVHQKKTPLFSSIFGVFFRQHSQFYFCNATSTTMTSLLINTHRIRSLASLSFFSRIISFLVDFLFFFTYLYITNAECNTYLLFDALQWLFIPNLVQQTVSINHWPREVVDGIHRDFVFFVSIE